MVALSLAEEEVLKLREERLAEIKRRRIQEFVRAVFMRVFGQARDA